MKVKLTIYILLVTVFTWSNKLQSQSSELELFKQKFIGLKGVPSKLLIGDIMSDSNGNLLVQSLHREMGALISYDSEVSMYNSEFTEIWNVKTEGYKFSLPHLNQMVAIPESEYVYIVNVKAKPTAFSTGITELKITQIRKSDGDNEEILLTNLGKLPEWKGFTIKYQMDEKNLYFLSTPIKKDKTKTYYFNTINHESRKLTSRPFNLPDIKPGREKTYNQKDWEYIGVLKGNAIFKALRFTYGNKETGAAGEAKVDIIGIDVTSGEEKMKTSKTYSYRKNEAVYSQNYKYMTGSGANASSNYVYEVANVGLNQLDNQIYVYTLSSVYTNTESYSKNMELFVTLIDINGNHIADKVLPVPADIANNDRFNSMKIRKEKPTGYMGWNSKLLVDPTLGGYTLVLSNNQIGGKKIRVLESYFIPFSNKAASITSASSFFNTMKRYSVENYKWREIPLEDNSAVNYYHLSRNETRSIDYLPSAAGPFLRISNMDNMKMEFFPLLK